MRYEGNLFVCLAEYVQGSLNIPLGKGGALVLFEKSLRYEYKDFTLKVPYQNILDVEYSKNAKNILRKFPEPNFGYDYEKQDWGGLSLSEWLLYWGLIALSTIALLVILKASENYTYITITYEVNDQSEWITFKIRTKDAHKLMPILNKKILV
jgi:hypothetical protein